MKKIRVFSLLAMLFIGLALVSCVPTPQACTHTWEEWTILKEATCLTSGLKERECIKCPERQEEVIAKGAHKYVNYIDDEVHCTKEKTSTAVCEHGCGTKDVKVIGAAPGHTHVEVSRIDATCTEAGEVVYSCHCGDSYSEELQSLGHEYEMEETVKVSCTTAGVNTFTCKACNDSYTEEVEATGHHHEVTSQINVTCTTDGEIVYTCPDCGDSYTEIIKTTGHKHELVSMVEVSCETDGETIYKCHCGDEIVEIVPSKGHSYKEIYETKLSCYEDEKIIYECHRCGDSYEEVLQFATGHNVEKWALVNEYEVDMCLYEQLYYGECTECYEGVNKEEYLEKHSYTEEVKVAILATCQEDGIKAYHCVCGKVEERSYSNPNAHNWVVDAETVLLNANSAVTYHCAHEGCTETKSEIVINDTKGEVSVENLATSGVQLSTATIKLDEETLAGLSNENVTITADVLEGEALDSIKEKLGEKAEAIGDNQIYNFGLSQSGNYIEDEFNGYVTVSVPYELAEGEDPESIAIWFVDEDGNVETIQASYANNTATFQVKHFSYYTVTRLSPAERCELYGHVHTDIVKEPTCIEQGYTIHVCQRCGQSSKGEYVPALGHNTVVETTPATCLKNGKEVHKCSAEGCGYSYTVIIRANGHDYETVKVEPTCLEDGHYSHTCAECGQSYEEIVPATGHKYTHEDQPATCTDDGLRTYTCVCGDSYTEVIKATGHKYKVIEKVKPTLETEGYAIYECANCGHSYTEILPVLDEETTTPNLDLIVGAFESLASQNISLVLSNVHINVPMGSVSDGKETVEYYMEYIIEELYITLDEEGNLIGSGFIDYSYISGYSTYAIVKCYIFKEKLYMEVEITDSDNITETQVMVCDYIALISEQYGEISPEQIEAMLGLVQKWYDESFYQIAESIADINGEATLEILEAIISTVYNIEELEDGYFISLNIAALHDLVAYLYENTIYDALEVVFGSEILENINLLFDFNVSALIDFLAEKGLVVEDLVASLDDLVVILSEVGMLPEGISTVNEAVMAMTGMEEFDIISLITSEDVQNITVGDLVLMIIANSSNNNTQQNKPGYEEDYIDGKKESYEGKDEVVEEGNEQPALTIEDIVAMINSSLEQFKSITAFEYAAAMMGAEAEQVKDMVSELVYMAESGVHVNTILDKNGEFVETIVSVELYMGTLIQGNIIIDNDYEITLSYADLKEKYDSVTENIDLIKNVETVFEYLCQEPYYETYTYEVCYDENGELQYVTYTIEYIDKYFEKEMFYAERTTYTFTKEDLENVLYYMITPLCNGFDQYYIAIPTYRERMTVLYVVDKESEDAGLIEVESYIDQTAETVYECGIYFNATTNEFTNREGASHNFELNEEKSVYAEKCGETNIEYYECSKCGEAQTYSWKKSHEFDYENAKYELLGSSCEEGILTTIHCFYCDFTQPHIEYWHKEIYTEISLHELGAKCGGYIYGNSCLCGQNSYFDYNFWCNFNYKEVYYNEWEDYLAVYTCHDCGFKYAEKAEKTYINSCSYVVYRTYYLGISDVKYDETTNTYEIVDSLLEMTQRWSSGIDHQYQMVENEQTDTYYHGKEVCDCGSYNIYTYQYDEFGNEIYSEYEKYNALDNYKYGSRYEYEMINGKNYKVRSYEYNNDYWYEWIYEYHFGEAEYCYYVGYYTNSYGDKDIYEEICCEYNSKNEYIYPEKHFCSQPIVEIFHNTCLTCGHSETTKNVIEPKGHSIEYLPDQGFFVCYDCELVSFVEPNREVILEDCTDYTVENIEYYTVGYFYYEGKYEFIPVVYLMNVETHEQIFIEEIDFIYHEEGNYISFSIEQVYKFIEMNGIDIESTDYYLGFNFISSHGYNDNIYGIIFA